MAFIYTPSGMAREYAPLALNIYTGCEHGCLYCYAPNCLQRNREDFHSRPTPRKDLLAGLAKEALKYSGTADRILLCFTCDPYQPCEEDYGTTRQALRQFVDAGAPFQILTKGGTRAVRDFDLLEKGDGAFATSLVWTDDKDRQHWEPKAAPVEDRLAAIAEAHRRGLPTWVSIEPVIDPAQALHIIRDHSDIVDTWKVGKLNHHPAAIDIDWQAFTDELYLALIESGRPYLVKESLRLYLPKGAIPNTICQSEPKRLTRATLF